MLIAHAQDDDNNFAQSSYPKLHNFVHYYHSAQAVDGVVKSLNASLSSLILKAARIIDEVDKMEEPDRKSAIKAPKVI